MKKDSDFSAAQRGKFFREGATLNLPVYLDEEVRGDDIKRCVSAMAPRVILDTC